MCWFSLPAGPPTPAARKLAAQLFPRAAPPPRTRPYASASRKPSQDTRPGRGMGLPQSSVLGVHLRDASCWSAANRWREWTASSTVSKSHGRPRGLCAPGSLLFSNSVLYGDDDACLWPASYQICKHMLSILRIFVIFSDVWSSAAAVVRVPVPRALILSFRLPVCVLVDSWVRFSSV